MKQCILQPNLRKLDAPPFPPDIATSNSKGQPLPNTPPRPPQEEQNSKTRKSQSTYTTKIQYTTHTTKKWAVRKSDWDLQEIKTLGSHCSEVSSIVGS